MLLERIEPIRSGLKTGGWYLCVRTVTPIMRLTGSGPVRDHYVAGANDPRRDIGDVAPHRPIPHGRVGDVSGCERLVRDRPVGERR